MLCIIADNVCVRRENNTNQRSERKTMSACQVSQKNDLKETISSLRVAIMEAKIRERCVECTLNDILTYGNIIRRCEAAIKVLESL